MGHMDRQCKNCGEMWSIRHIAEMFEKLNSPYPEPSYRLKEKDSEKIVKDNEGNRWRLWFIGARAALLDGSIKVMLCPACEPDVGKEDCEECFGSGRVYSWAHRVAPWKYGHIPNVKSAPHPFRRTHKTITKDGVVHNGVSHCPSCFEDTYAYVAAMLESGWDELAIQGRMRLSGTLVTVAKGG